MGLAIDPEVMKHLPTGLREMHAELAAREAAHAPTPPVPTDDAAQTDGTASPADAAPPSQGDGEGDWRRLDLPREESAPPSQEEQAQGHAGADIAALREELELERQRYRSLQGNFQRLNGDFSRSVQENATLAQEIVRLRDDVRRASEQQHMASPVVTNGSLPELSEDERDLLDDETMAVIQKVVAHQTQGVAQRVDQMQSQWQQRDQAQAAASRAVQQRQYRDTLTAGMPDWQKVWDAEAFHTWLAKNAALKRGFEVSDEALDAPAVLRVFQEYRAQMTTQQQDPARRALPDSFGGPAPTASKKWTREDLDREYQKLQHLSATNPVKAFERIHELNKIAADNGL